MIWAHPKSVTIRRALGDPWPSRLLVVIAELTPRLLFPLSVNQYLVQQALGRPVVALPHINDAADVAAQPVFRR